MTDYIKNNLDNYKTFVWVNNANKEATLDPTSEPADQTFTIYPFNTKWFIPYGSNNKPLWDPNDQSLSRYWNLNSSPLKPDGTPYFDTSNPPKFRLIRPEWYEAVY